MGKNVERASLLGGCREAVELLRRALRDPLVLGGMDAEQARAVAQHLNGALGVLDAAVQATEAYKLVTLLDGVPRGTGGSGHRGQVAPPRSAPTSVVHQARPAEECLQHEPRGQRRRRQQHPPEPGHARLRLRA